MQFLSRFDILELMMTPTFWVSVATVIVVTLLVYWLLTRLIAFVKRGITTWGDKHPTTNRMRFILTDMLNRTSRFLLFVVALLISLRFVDLPDRLFSTVSHAWFLVFAIQVALWLDQGVVSWLRHVMLAPGSHKNPVTLVITGLILRAIVWSVMLLSILANAGVNITALVASLGVGGIAIALAVQTILSDVFASLSIGFDKPFEIGDFVVFNDVAGTVEHIGLKTTRIRSLSRLSAGTPSCCNRRCITTSGCKRGGLFLPSGSPATRRRKNCVQWVRWSNRSLPTSGKRSLTALISWASIAIA